MKGTIKDLLRQRQDALDRRVLAALRVHGEMGIYDLTKRAGARSGTVVPSLARLENAGEVTARWTGERRQRRLYSAAERPKK